ncbi:MAG: hypothetical protein KAG91_01225 [Mycoplasmataceae bacterium]|nr:hypothetical protein [Mycoplasmataceae bacterium]
METYRDPFVTAEMANINKRRRNKLFITAFLSLILITILLKSVDNIMLDLGYKDGSIHLGFWNDPKWVSATDKPTIAMVERHPNFLWPMTQFTWITTGILTLLLIFRFFKYDQGTLPRWIKWIMTQRTLSLLTMYDMIVGVVFWASMFNGFQDKFNPDLQWLELTITILVHAVIPLITLSYSIIYLLRDKKASILKEGFVFKGMMYPLIYIAYYILISVIWTDPYPITNLHDDITGDLWKLPLAILGIYVLLGFMILFHNLMIKYNRNYDYRNDYEIKNRRQKRIEKIKRKVIRKYKE